MTIILLVHDGSAVVSYLMILLTTFLTSSMFLQASRPRLTSGYKSSSSCVSLFHSAKIPLPLLSQLSNSPLLL